MQFGEWWCLFNLTGSWIPTQTIFLVETDSKLRLLGKCADASGWMCAILLWSPNEATANYCRHKAYQFEWPWINLNRQVELDCGTWRAAAESWVILHTVHTFHPVENTVLSLLLALKLDVFARCSPWYHLSPKGQWEWQWHLDPREPPDCKIVNLFALIHEYSWQVQILYSRTSLHDVQLIWKRSIQDLAQIDSLPKVYKWTLVWRKIRIGALTWLS